MNNTFFKTIFRSLCQMIALIGSVSCFVACSPEQAVEEIEEEPFFILEEIPGRVLTYPTPQKDLEDVNDPAVFMPTGSGRVESAAYGSTRTRGGRPAFHEGVDIAPMERDSKGRALDPVFAVADGRVGYISRRGGNSSYGTYIVLEHTEPFGLYHTLYAHLESVSGSLKVGDEVRCGTTIGRMGNSSTLGIPVQRSHLHFELGVMLNNRFKSWLESKEMTATHGNYHGWNLVGLNPDVLFPLMKEEKPFVFEDCILNTPVAFRLVVEVKEKPEYYHRYPSLWIGDDPAGAMVVDVSESGVPLRARSASEEEKSMLGTYNSRVLEAFSEVLGRNAKRIVVPKGERWITGSNANQWLDILLY
jgi:murein DD-endopeptidase MepM/ murein hydrolase activator NlpD